MGETLISYPILLQVLQKNLKSKVEAIGLFECIMLQKTQSVHYLVLVAISAPNADLKYFWNIHVLYHQCCSLSNINTLAIANEKNQSWVPKRLLNDWRHSQCTDDVFVGILTYDITSGVYANVWLHKTKKIM